nr:photosystem I assembly protein Ycf37 [Proteomonas sp. NEIS-1375]
MENFLPLIYLSVLLIVLLALTITIIQQVVKRQQVERDLSALLNDVRTGQATAENYYTLGTIYLSKKLYDQAILQFRYALKNWDIDDAPGLSNLYNTIGFTYFETKQYDLAIYYYEEALKINDSYVVALNNLAYAYEKQGSVQRAIPIYQKVLGFDSQNTTAIDRLQLLQRRYTKSG